MTRVFSVTEFIAAINDIVAGQFSVEGEISGYSVSQGKWAFFSLKDETALLNCFAVVYRLPFPLQDGMRVRVTGYPRIYERSGKFSLTVEAVELVGEGALRRAYELLKKQLTAEGLFAPERKRSLAQFPARVGVITSRETAAWGDFKRIITNRWGGMEIVLRHTVVQGASAVEDIVAAFLDFNRDFETYDAVVLIRGGGSLEDFAAFNSVPVVRAIYASRIPVLVGVGHERDETLADFVADARASTPSNAAEMLVPERKEFLDRLATDGEFMAVQLEHALSRRTQEVDNAAVRLGSGSELMLARVKNVIDYWPQFLERLAERLERYRETIHSTQRLLASLSPREVLKRGYSITRRADGALVRDSAAVDSGETVVIELQRGAVRAKTF